MVKINNPNATKGNIIAALHNNNIWKLPSSGINLANLEKQLLVQNGNPSAVLSYNLTKEVKAKFNLNLENGLLTYQDNFHNIDDISYAVLADSDFTIVKISFDCIKEFGDLKKGNYYHMIFFKTHPEVDNLLRVTEIQVLGI